MVHLIALALSFQGSTALPQEIAIRGSVSCPACRILRDTVVMLDSEYAVIPKSAAVVGYSLFIVPDQRAAPTVLRFDLRTGRFLGPLARSGSGPGELVDPEIVIRLPGDSLFVFDKGLQRYSVFAPVTFKFVRGSNLSIRRNTGTVVESSTGNVWMSASVASADQVGFPIHIFNREGRWLRSTGPTPARLRWDGHLNFARHLALGTDGAVWALTRYGQIALESYGPDGRLRQRLAYSTEWSRPLAEAPKLGDPPAVERVPFAVGEGNEVWVASLIPDADWRKGLTASSNIAHGPNAPVVGDLAKLFDSVVEIVDTRLQTIIGRLRIDEAVVAVLAPGLVLIYREENDGTPILWLERWSIRGRNPQVTKEVP